MPKPLNDQDQQSFLAERHVAVLSVARGPGRAPLSTPIWYGYEPGGNVTFFTGVNASKLRIIQHAGVVSLTVQREEPPYKFVSISGTVVSTDSPPSSDQIFAIASRYMPEDAARWMASATAETRGYELISVDHPSRSLAKCRLYRRHDLMYHDWPWLEHCPSRRRPPLSSAR